jgi:hypothetical protein
VVIHVHGEGPERIGQPRRDKETDAVAFDLDVAIRRLVQSQAESGAGSTGSLVVNAQGSRRAFEPADDLLRRGPGGSDHIRMIVHAMAPCFVFSVSYRMRA